MKDEVSEATLLEVYSSSFENFRFIYDKLCMSKVLTNVMMILQPMLDKLESLTGRGGNLNVGTFHKKNDQDDDEIQMSSKNNKFDSEDYD